MSLTFSSPYDTGDRCFIDGTSLYLVASLSSDILTDENLVVKQMGLFAVRTYLTTWDDSEV
jgi:hypothetical protein